METGRKLEEADGPIKEAGSKVAVREGKAAAGESGRSGGEKVGVG